MNNKGIKVLESELCEGTGRRGQTRQFWKITLECGHQTTRPARWNKAGKKRRGEIMRWYGYAVEDGKIPAWKDGKVTTPVINQRPDDCAPAPKHVRRCGVCHPGFTPRR